MCSDKVRNRVLPVRGVVRERDDENAVGVIDSEVAFGGWSMLEAPPDSSGY